MAAERQYSTRWVILNTYQTYRHRSGTGLTRAGVAVLAAIRRAKVKAIGREKLAKRTGLSAETVSRSIKDLEALGYIRVTRTPGFECEYEVLRGIK